MIAHIEANPGCATSQIAEAMGMAGPGTSTMLTRLRQAGKIRREGTGRRSEWYVGAEQQIAQADENGARTDLERQVLAVLNGSGLTTEEVAKNVDGINFATAGNVCAALARRGVIERRPMPSGSVMWARSDG